MSESTITLPVVVEDRAALAELKKIQKELGAAGVESAKLNKQIEDSMKNMASKVGKAYGDMGLSLAGLKNKWTEFSSAINVAQQGFGWAKQAIDLAKYSAEFSRLERAVPVERMRALQAETGGTVSKFDLLKRAAKEMGLSATAGLDDASKRMQQTLITWENTVDSIKAGLGSIAMTAIDWLDRLSDSIAGVETIRTRRDQARANAKRNIIDRRPQDPNASFAANAARNYVDEDSPEFLDEVAKQEKWLIRNNVGADAAAPRAILDAALRAQRDRPGAWSGLLKPSGGSIVPSIGDAYRSAQMWNAEAALQPGKRKDTKWTFGDLVSPTAHYGADIVNAGAGALGDWSQSANGVGSVFSRIGGIGGGLAGAVGGAYEAGAGGMREGLGAQADKLAEFRKQIQDNTSAVGAAYSVLSSGLAAGVEAAIAGSDSIGRAALKAAQTSLRAIAVQSAVKAIYSTAEGLFTGNPANFAAAAKYTAAAIAAGVGSAALGSMAGSAGPSAGASAGGGNAANAVPTASQSVQSGPQTIVVNIGGGVLAMDKGQLGEVVVKAIDAGKRVGRVRNDRDVSVQYG